MRRVSRIVSRLGNGQFWYVHMGTLLAVKGVTAARDVLRMVLGLYSLSDVLAGIKIGALVAGMPH